MGDGVRVGVAPVPALILTRREDGEVDMIRQLKPYQTLQGALKALDNGGRSYNAFPRAGDDVVEATELARAAGSVASGKKAFLHFEMALMDLPWEDAGRVVASLAPSLLVRYTEERPTVLAPSAVETEGHAGRSTIVTGYPVFVEDRTQLTGYIVLVTPVIMVLPIFDQFDVYEVFDTPACLAPRTIVATARRSRRLDGVMTRFGGTLRELYFEDQTAKDHGHYLEVAFYTPLEALEVSG